ncbi:protein CANDIDATE G-PROTEIN COUPLED RECEPTOR 2-like [Amaranthus tricolor]|uniref:protein CANDIDATE G-PROTEIN COUPLED RECEPTOR 2-like n=1 Tax=Amaranthus tricolor TaxID=29722 RepID=UPI00258514E7|nr:protein CANDIDATE G-PROTEIN COUPLED RECEPTOR 2-like [Amaranthus tricolor]
MSSLSLSPALDIPISSESNSSATIAETLSLKTDDHRFYNWLFDCHGFWHNFFLILSSALFLLYLAFQAKKCYTKLCNGRSHIINSYYGIVWLVTLLNFAWCCLQIWECTPGKTLSWNLLSLFTTSGLLFLEVSLIAFLLQGNYTSSTEALTRTFAISAFLVGLDICLKGIYVFAFGVPLFIESEHSHRMKWGLWIVHKLVPTAVYGFILFMYHSSWRERLPARPAYHKYITIMFGVNGLTLFACFLSGTGFWFWLYDIIDICYHALYLPLIYKTFLADFFQEEDLNLDNVYYSEMKDAGFFDSDWE